MTAWYVVPVLICLELLPGCRPSSVVRNSPVPQCAPQPSAGDTLPSDSANVLEGRVCLEATGQPLRDVTVSVDVAGRRLATRTDASGHFLLSPVPLGESTVRARMIGYYIEERKIVFGDCGLVVVDTAAHIVQAQAANRETCRHRQWLAFYLRPHPVF